MPQAECVFNPYCLNRHFACAPEQRACVLRDETCCCLTYKIQEMGKLPQVPLSPLWQTPRACVSCWGQQPEVVPATGAWVLTNPK